MRQPTMVFRLILPFSLHLKHLPETAGDGRALESDLVVIGPVDVSDQHVDCRVVSDLRHPQHIVEASGAGKQGKETP